jgi:ribosomal protein S18 acetylase RimI-like enzyme
MSLINFNIIEGPLAKEIKTKISNGFKEYNKIKGSSGKSDPVSFSAYEGEKFAGSVAVELFCGQLHIKNVLVLEDYRNKEIAKDLMQKALDYGRRHNCSFAFVETMNYQAPKFYQKLGFVIEFTRSGYENDSSFCYVKMYLEK